MSAIAAFMVWNVQNLIGQILIIVGAVATLWGIIILAQYGFKKLRSVGGYDAGRGYWEKLEDDDEVF